MILRTLEGAKYGGLAGPYSSEWTTIDELIEPLKSWLTTAIAYKPNLIVTVEIHAKEEDYGKGNGKNLTGKRT